ncbi:hypothetical protein [Alcanivorax sp. S6407]|nr:hypothetical protein [Alcanivorax sp. S6407]
MLDTMDAMYSPCIWGLVETGRCYNGGINGALDKYLCWRADARVT